MKSIRLVAILVAGCWLAGILPLPVEAGSLGE